MSDWTWWQQTLGVIAGYIILSLVVWDLAQTIAHGARSGWAGRQQGEEREQHDRG